MSKKALITGITGQDGSYLAELLLAKGYEVHGIIRRTSMFNTHRLDPIYQDPHESHRQLILHYGDLSDAVSLVNLVREIAPDEVYNLGAQTHVKVSFETPEYTGDVSGVGTIRLLEAIRAAKIDTRFYQASTSELFGSSPPPQSESKAAAKGSASTQGRPSVAPAVTPPSASAAAPQVAAHPVAPARSVAAAPSPVVDRWAQFTEELHRCQSEGFLSRVVCDQRVRIRFCDGYWGKVPQCPGGIVNPDRGQ